MITLLGLRLPVVVEVFCRKKKKKKVIKKNELKMIYYSSLHRQGIASGGSGLHLTLQGVGPERSTEILTWLILTNPAWLSLPGLYCPAEWDTVLWHLLSQNLQMTPTLSASSPSSFLYFWSEALYWAKWCGALLPSAALWLWGETWDIKTNNKAMPSGLFVLFPPKTSWFKTKWCIMAGCHWHRYHCFL